MTANLYTFDWKAFANEFFAPLNDFIDYLDFDNFDDCEMTDMPDDEIDSEGYEISYQNTSTCSIDSFIFGIPDEGESPMRQRIERRRAEKRKIRDRRRAQKLEMRDKKRMRKIKQFIEAFNEMLMPMTESEKLMRLFYLSI